MKIGESAQDYLESILILSNKLEYVRAIDICSYFGYARATVSISLKHLKESNLVNIDGNNHITLTKEGREIAESTYERHCFLTEFFKSLGIPEEIAALDACRIEHYVSETTFEAMKKNLTPFS